MSLSEGNQEVEATAAKPVDELQEKILDLNLGATAYQGNSDCTAVHVPPNDLVNFMTELKDNDDLKFDMLSTHTAVDRIVENAFELFYYLNSLTNQRHLLVSVTIPRDNPIIPTLSGIWKTAEWQEREVYDLFGICYDNHPDLRRVFLEDEWKGFPLRKDYKDDFMLTREPKES
jgi:NADH-quinone oxidoreductase subunit C